MSPLTGPDSLRLWLDKRFGREQSLGVILAEWVMASHLEKHMLMKRAKPSRHYATGGMKN